jgi:hypothetical protein
MYLLVSTSTANYEENVTRQRQILNEQRSMDDKIQGFLFQIPQCTWMFIGIELMPLICAYTEEVSFLLLSLSHHHLFTMLHFLLSVFIAEKAVSRVMVVTF